VGATPPITAISVRGYKALIDPVRIEFGALTILAGANSSGKSSVMQPMLLLKQTLEASYDPGPLRIDGPNVEFTATDQFFSRTGKRRTAIATELAIGVETDDDAVTTILKRGGKVTPLDVLEMRGVTSGVMGVDGLEGHEYVLRPSMPEDDLWAQLPPDLRDLYEGFRDRRNIHPLVRRNRCFLEIALASEGSTGFITTAPLASKVDRVIRALIHIPGLRGNPERLYPVSAVGPVYPGQFQSYVASIIAQWEASGEADLIQALGDDLRRLGLSWRVRAVPVSDTQVEIQVGRLPQAAQGGAWDLVSIADVGFGVSQVLPILVALRAARPGQTIYVEQPEIHLHPRAQVEMAHVMGEAVARGVRVIAETHSDLILLAVQTMVAEETLHREAVRLHWFSRDAEGTTNVVSGGVDEAGTFGDWPEDFADVQLEAKDAYLTVAEPKLRAEEYD
jgi:hypothetical protein